MGKRTTTNGWTLKHRFDAHMNAADTKKSPIDSSQIAYARDFQFSQIAYARDFQVF